MFQYGGEGQSWGCEMRWRGEEVKLLLASRFCVVDSYHLAITQAGLYRMILIMQ